MAEYFFADGIMLLRWPQALPRLDQRIEVALACLASAWLLLFLLLLIVAALAPSPETPKQFKIRERGDVEVPDTRDWVYDYFESSDCW